MTNRFRRPSKEQRRVVVTGLSSITPLGNNATDTWQGLISGKSGIGPVTQFDTSTCDVKIAGEVKDFQIDQYVPKKEQKKK